MRERSHLLRDLRMAFDESQLFLTYQPKVELATGRVAGAVALLRWRRDDGYLAPPDRFIPVAEQSGLIVGMGSWLLQIALLALQRFRAAGFPNMHMAVNVVARAVAAGGLFGGGAGSAAANAKRSIGAGDRDHRVRRRRGAGACD